MAVFKKEQIPNYISIFRIILIPLYVLFFFGIIPSFDSLISSGIIFFVAGVSDLVDGYLARKNNWITDLGKLLDPFADKMMELTINICMAIRFQGAFIILAGFTILKEAVMIVGAYIILKHGKIAVSSVWYGKAATFAWFLTVFSVSFIPAAAPLRQYFCAVLIGFMIFAFVMYVIHFKDAIAKTWAELHKDKETNASQEEAEEIE